MCVVWLWLHQTPTRLYNKIAVVFCSHMEASNIQSGHPWNPKCKHEKFGFGHFENCVSIGPVGGLVDLEGSKMKRFGHHWAPECQCAHLWYSHMDAWTRSELLNPPAGSRSKNPKWNTQDALGTQMSECLEPNDALKKLRHPLFKAQTPTTSGRSDSIGLLSELM